MCIAAASLRGCRRAVQTSPRSSNNLKFQFYGHENNGIKNNNGNNSNNRNNSSNNSNNRNSNKSSTSNNINDSI